MPTRCVCCDLPGTLLCSACAAELPYIDFNTACPACAAPYGKLACTQCTPPYPERLTPQEKASFPFTQARAALSYEGGAVRLVTAYKDGGELRVDALLAQLLAGAVTGRQRGLGAAPACGGAGEDWSIWADALVSVPARKEALRRRGFNHMGRVAELAAQDLGLPLLPALRHARKVADQRGLGQVQRAANLAGSLALAPAADVRGKRIVLVDDVLTTCATASAAASVLLAGGAAEVRCAVVARVW